MSTAKQSLRREGTSTMIADATSLPGVLVIRPAVHGDNRGCFFESWEQERYAALGMPAEWKQDNVVFSTQGVLRGLHFQHPDPQFKLVSVVSGSVFDVAVDVRRGSPTFGKWVGVELSAENHRQLAVPEGFAHGYIVTAPHATVVYKCSTRYNPAAERVLRWDDSDVGVGWPTQPASLSERDARGLLLRDFGETELPPFGA